RTVTWRNGNANRRGAGLFPWRTYAAGVQLAPRKENGQGSQISLVRKEIFSLDRSGSLVRGLFGFRGQILRRLGNRNVVFRLRNCRHLTRRGEGFLRNFFQLLLAILLGQQRVALRFYVVTAPIHLLV